MPRTTKSCEAETKTNETETKTEIRPVTSVVKCIKEQDAGMVNSFQHWQMMNLYTVSSVSNKSKWVIKLLILHIAQIFSDHDGSITCLTFTHKNQWSTETLAWDRDQNFTRRDWEEDSADLARFRSAAGEDHCDWRTVAVSKHTSDVDRARPWRPDWQSTDDGRPCHRHLSVSV